LADSLRDMVVSLSLNSDNFTANLRSINQQLKEADSQFKLAASGVTDFENTTAGAQAQLQALQQKFQLQQQAVQQYERALEAAQKKLETSAQSHEKLAAKLETAKQGHADLGQQVDKLTADLREAEEAGLKGTDAYAEMEAELERLKAEYAASGQEVEKLEGQLSRSENAVRRNADAVTRANTNLNNARAGLQQTQAQIDQVTSRLERLQNAWLNAADKMAKFGETATAAGKKVEAVGRSMSKLSAVAIGAGTVAVKTFASYDDAIRQVYATMGLSESESAAEMRALSDAAQEMGASTRYSAGEAASALNYLALAGYDSQKAIAALPTVLNLAQAGGIDLASASDMVTDSMSALGLQMSYMPTFADQMAKTAQKSNTSVAQLGEGILKVSATAKNLKGGTVELNTALGILADNGIKGAEGGTHLRNVILSLQNPTDSAAKKLESMGVKVYDAQGNMRGLNEILGDLETSMHGWSQEAKDAALSDIFNKTDLAAVNALLSNCSDRWNELSGEISDCQGTAQSMADMMEGGIGGAFRSLKSAVEGLAISFGDTLAPTIKSIAEKITEYVRKFTSMDEAHKKAIVKFAAIVAAAGPLVLILGKIITAVGTTTTGISKLMVFVTKIPGGFTKATSAVSTFATKGVTAVKTLMSSVSAAGGGMKGLLTVISGSPAAIAVFAAAAAYGIYKLIDWASGAKAAREAQERLNETVKEWGDNVTTAFEKSEGLSKFGLTAEDFSVDKIGSDWLSQTIATWTDGKRETDEILNSTVKGFTDGTETIRASLQSLKDSAGGTALGDLDGDLATLDAIDAEVESILKKKQNGYLSDDETARLQALMDQREAIQVKYHLVADSEGAFGQIVDGVNAAMSRGADGAATYTDAFAAATQGLGSFVDSLNSEYDARYKVISAMEDGAEKERQLGELRTWYDTQAQAATEQYYNTLLQTAQATSVFAEGGQFAETAAQLQNINTLMHAAAGKDGMSAEMTALRDALVGLDETSIVELEAAIAAMETAAADAGQSVPEEVLAAKTALEEVKAAATDTSNVFSDDVAASIDTMFSGLGDETHEVFASLNCDNLSTAYDAWAAGEHQAIIPSLDTESLTEIDLTGNITNVLAKEGASFEIDAKGNITGIGWPEGTTFETDVKGNITSATTPEGTVYTVDAKGNITSVSKPDGVTYAVDTQGNVTGITNPDGTAFTVDTKGNVTSITTGGENPFTVACTGNIKNVSWPEGSTYETDVTGNVTGITTPDGTTYAVDAAGNITSVTTQSGVTYSVDGSGKITAVALDPGVTLPTVDLQATATVSQVNFDEGQFTNSGRPDLEFDAGANKTNNNFLGWQDWSASGTVEQLHTLAQAVRDLEAAKAEVSGMEEMGIPDVAAYDAACQKVNALGDSVTYLGQSFGTEMSYEGGLGFQAMAQYVANGMQLMNDGALDGSQIEQYTQVVSDLTTVMNSQAGEAAASAGTVGTTLSDGMADAMNGYDWNTTGSTVMSDIVSGFEAAGGDLSQVGDDVAAGIGEGEAAHDFSGDASTTIDNDESALRNAADSHSPAARFNPLGDDIAAGIGQGMAQHEFSADAQSVISAIQSAFTPQLFTETGTQAASGLAQGLTGADMSSAGATVSANAQRAVNGNLTASTLRPTGTLAVAGLAAGLNAYSFGSVGSSVASRVRSSVSGSLNSSTLTSVGRNVMAGLAAGIRSGSSSVVSAMRSAAQAAVSAAKAALQIHSPSRVFRDEVGVMVMKGFGEGIRNEANEQARIIGNAARFLTDVAQGGVATGNADNRRTYNNTSTVNLHVANMNVRDKQDIRSLAIEIAGLTKTQQRGRGLRMA